MNNTTETAKRNGVFGTLLSIPVLILNGLTLIWMIQLRNMCKKQKVLFVGHLLADLLVGCFVFIEAQASLYRLSSPVFCYVNLYVCQYAGIVTSFMAVLQTADKFMVLRFTYWYSGWVTWQKLLNIVVFLYCFSIAAMFGLFFIEFDINIICTVVTIGGKFGNVCIIIFYILCICAIVGMWIIIGKIVKRHRRCINDTSLSETVLAKEIKHMLTIVIIVCLYTISYVPSVVYLCFYLQHWSDREQYVRDNPTTISVLFFMSNSILNPIVYIWRLKFYRNSCVDKLIKVMFKDSSITDQSSVPT